MRLTTLCSILSLLTISLADDRRLPPTITRQNEKSMEVVRIQQEFELQCEGTGIPDVEYHWKKNGIDFELTGENLIPSTTGTFKFKQIGFGDSGSYQCFVRNQHGTAMTDVINLVLAVLGSPPGTIEPVIKHVTEGDPLMIKCEGVLSVPEPVRTWALVIDYNDNQEGSSPVTIGKRVQQDDNGNLYFAYVKRGDQQSNMYYECTQKNLAKGQSVFGSYTQINVERLSSVPDSRPILAYNTKLDSGTSVIAIKGETLELQCLFSGKPTPAVEWSRAGTPLPSSRLQYQNDRTKLIIELVEDEEEDTYTCTGSNTEAEQSFSMRVDVQSKPVFTSDEMKPVNVNATEGDDVIINCDSEAEPAATPSWFINGEPLDEHRLPSRVSLSNNDKRLTIDSVCKECLGGGSDLNVYQCNSSNTNGYSFSSGYLNVLVATEMTISPVNVILEYGEIIRFTCDGTSDDSTPISIIWYHGKYRLDKIPEVIEFEDNHSTLLIHTEDLDQQGYEYVGSYTCVISNGYSSANATAYLEESPVSPPVVAGVGDYWWVFVILGILLLLLLFFLICCICMQRNKGDSYPVDEKERANGNDPEKELADSGFHDYQRPEDEPIKGSRASLSSAMKVDESDDDDASLAEYGDIDTGKFNEDGSFIGQYNTADRRRAGESNV